MYENGTTIWIDRETKNDLQKIADDHGRTLVGQIRWMVKRDLAENDEAQPAEPALQQPQE